MTRRSFGAPRLIDANNSIYQCGPFDSLLTMLPMPSLESRCSRFVSHQLP